MRQLRSRYSPSQLRNIQATNAHLLKNGFNANSAAIKSGSDTISAEGRARLGLAPLMPAGKGADQERAPLTSPMELARRQRMKRRDTGVDLHQSVYSPNGSTSSTRRLGSGNKSTTVPRRYRAFGAS